MYIIFKLESWWVCSYAADQKLHSCLCLNIAGNNWDNVSTQNDKIHENGLVDFRHLYVGMLHIVSLIRENPEVPCFQLQKL